MDPYDYAAARLPSDRRAAVTAFWEHFIRHTDGLDGCFSSGMRDRSTDPVTVMAALREVSPELMWEFGPSQRGHALCITAEWRDELRPLARLMREMAPDLPRWEFLEARRPSAPEELSPANLSGRLQGALRLTDVTAKPGLDGRIDLVGHGTGSADELSRQALVFASMLLGEAEERDWIGACDGEPEKSGFLGMFRGGPKRQFDPLAIAERLHDEIARARAARPERPYGEVSLDDRPTTLFRLTPRASEQPRADLVTYAAPSEVLARAMLGGARFSSGCYSRHGEWFIYLRVPRSLERPFDNVDDRSALEQALHEALSEDGLGGFVAGGHGENHVYIDLAMRDVGRGIDRVSEVMAAAGLARDATIHFFDQGLTALIIPAAPPSSQVH